MICVLMTTKDYAVVMEENQIIHFFVTNDAHGSRTFEGKNQTYFFVKKTYLFCIFSAPMRLSPELSWSLAEMHDLCFFADSRLLIGDVFQFNGAFVCQIVKQI